MRPTRTLVLLAGIAASVLPFSSFAPAPSVSAWAPGARVSLSPWLSPPPEFSTSGDYATDTYGDPWDFSNDEDVNPNLDGGVGFAAGVSVGGGTLNVGSKDGTEIRLLMNWGQIEPVLPWGHDGWKHPLDAARYTQTTMRLRADNDLGMAIRFFTASGETGLIPFVLPGGGWQTMHFDLTDRSLYINTGALAQWAGPIVRFELFRGFSFVSPGQNPTVNLQLDWVRIHRADAPQTPPANVPVPRVLTPNETGGEDYATTVRGNPWDFAGLDDIVETHDMAYLDTSSGDLNAVSTANDPFLSLALGGDLDTDKYHRFTADICYTGPMSLADSKGGGMVGRIAWIRRGTLDWSETQDIVVLPGCHEITIDLATAPAEAIHDEHTAIPIGWRGISVDNLRFDPNEDRGIRGLTLRNIKLADEAAFSGNYAITFTDTANATGTVADIYVTTTEAGYAGTKIAAGLPVSPGTNTFNWAGLDAAGKPMPNGTYWTYVVIRNGSSKGVGYSTGPVRLERPVAATPSYYVPLTPHRLLDTRSGQGGNISALDTGVSTALTVMGVGGVPATGVTAVVMNVTAIGPTSAGFVTAWPSGQPRPPVSNLNFTPGMTVPNLITVMVGANGKVDLFNSSGLTHLAADIVGYYTSSPPPSGGRFTPLTPSRVLDTRDGTGALASPLGQSQVIDVAVTGIAGVPATGVSAVALNVTVDQPTGNGFLTVWPAGEPRPNASTHNFGPGLTIANLVLAKVGANGRVSIFNSAGNSHVIADVIGYFSSSGGLFVPVVPQRLVDTRDGTGGPGGQIGTGEIRPVAIAAGVPIPVGAKAVVVNVTSVNSSSPSFVTVWPNSTAKPLASTLNPRPGVPVPNQAYLRVGAGGGLDTFNALGATDLVIDVFGYIM